MTVGLMPIGGNARRMNGIPKFLLPVVDSSMLAVLYERMLRVTPKIILDVNARNREWVEMNTPDGALIYEWNAEPMSRALLLAREHIATEQTVLFGMPDTYWTDENVYETLLDNIGDAIVNVAVWYTEPKHRSKRGMCINDGGFNGSARLMEVIDKPSKDTAIHNETGRFLLVDGWGAMVWQPEFWQYIFPEDPHVGFALQRAIEVGENVRGYNFPGKYYDCGTPDEYYECIIETQGERLETI